MKVQINLELTDAMHLLAAFASDSEMKDSMEIHQRGQVVLDNIADQVNTIVTQLEKKQKIVSTSDYNIIEYITENSQNTQKKT